jgi:hypothetical protein
LSEGPGTGGKGAGNGHDEGIGDGDGKGFGPGERDGCCGGVYRPGNGISPPRIVRQVKPTYTSEAMRAKVQGQVLLECVVRPDGSVTDIRVARGVAAGDGH